MPEEAAVSRRNLAELDLAQGRIAAAITQARAAEALFRERDDQRGQSDAGLLRVQALLAARADDDAARAFAELAPVLKGASTEQHAIAQLVAAEIAAHGGRPVLAATTLRNAAVLARRAGVRALQLEVALAQATPTGATDPSLESATATLGNASVRLQWLELAMRRQLATGDRAGAAARYREALGWLRAGDYAGADALHRLGASALDGTAATIARERADAAHAAYRAALPNELRGGFDRETAAR